MSTRLEIEPAYRTALAAAGLTTFESFMHAAAGPAVSKHRHRETVPLELEVDGTKQRFFLKRVFRVPPAHAILPWLRLRPGYSQPAREWEACKLMREAGLPAMERVAFGERKSLGFPTQAFILVAASPYRHTLEEWLTPGFERPRALSEDERLDLICAVARLGQQIGDAGFDWPDADAKHIYAGLSSEGARRQWRFTLIDLERVTYKSNLASIQYPQVFFSIFRSMNPFRLRGLEFNAVCDALDIESARLKGWLLAHMYFARGTALVDGLRCVEGYIHPRRKHMQKLGDIQVNPRYESALRTAGIIRLDSVFELRSGQALTKPGLAVHRDRIRLELDYGDGNRRPAYLKRFRSPPLKEQLRRIWLSGFRRSTARLEARFARRLEEAGIGTLTTIAWGQEMRGGLERRSFLITDQVPGESLEKVAEQVMAGEFELSATDKFDVIRQLAMMTRRMHGEGLFHRDYYLCHHFLSRNSAGKLDLRVIDLGRMINRVLQGRGERWVVKDLGALDYSAPKSVVTRADRVPSLYPYLIGAQDRRRPDKFNLMRARGIVEAVARRNLKTAAHDAKRAMRHQRSQNRA